MFKAWREKRKQRALDKQRAIEAELRREVVADRLLSLRGEELASLFTDEELKADIDWFARTFPSRYTDIWNRALMRFEVAPDRFDERWADDIHTLNVLFASTVAGRDDFEELEKGSKRWGKLNTKQNLAPAEEAEKDGLWDARDLIGHYEIEVSNIDQWIDDSKWSYGRLKTLVADAHLGCVDIFSYNVVKVQDMLDAWPDEPNELEFSDARDAGEVRIATATPIDPATWRRNRDQSRAAWQRDREGKPAPDMPKRPAAAPTAAADTDVLVGHAAIFVFDYDRMGSAYGSEAFAAIGDALQSSTGACAFVDGDLEVAAGGPAKVPGMLMEIRDNGWTISSKRTDSPLIQLAVIDHLYAYVAGMWTNNIANVGVIDGKLAEELPDAYLGYFQHPQSLDLPKFHDIFRPLQLPVRVTYVDGVKKDPHA